MLWNGECLSTRLDGYIKRYDSYDLALKDTHPMMNASAISKFATKTNILLLFLAIILFSFVIFPMFETFNEGVRLKILDARFSYTQNDVIELFTQMKPEGRSNYFKMIVLIDMVYPLFYGAFLMLLTTFTL
ncbi:MAG: hypothetical protein Q8T08_13285, partial [Ignavibacteria bacterium]|nr:hypothetical protein [Ignavibacteria bacterium]